MLYPQETFDRVTEKDRKLLLRTGELMWSARSVYKKATGKRMDVVFECHTICRALAQEIGDGSVKYVDGNLLGLDISADGARAQITFCAHSWLITESGCIIDPYPMGIMSVNPLIIVPGGTYHHYAAASYRPDPSVTQKVSGQALWRKVRILRGLFRKAAASA